MGELKKEEEQERREIEQGRKEKWERKKEEGKNKRARKKLTGWELRSLKKRKTNMCEGERQKKRRETQKQTQTQRVRLAEMLSEGKFKKDKQKEEWRNRR